MVPNARIPKVAMNIVPVVTRDGLLLTKAQDYKRLHLTYLDALQHKITKPFRSIACSNSDTWSYYQYRALKGQLPLEVRWIDAYKGFGLFATDSIPGGYFIGEYSGILRKKRFFGDNDNGYLFAYPFRIGLRSYVIDAKNHGNHTRFINSSLKPNCKAVLIPQDAIYAIGFVTTVPIAKGTEIVYYYYI